MVLRVKDLGNVTFEDVKNWTHKYHMSIFTTPRYFDVALKYGRGSTVSDMNGKQYLDATGGIACKVTKYDGLINHTTNLFYIPEQAIYMKLIGELLIEKGIMKEPKFAFASSGCWANDTLFKGLSKTRKGKIVSLDGAFHGRTWLSLATTPNKRDPFLDTANPTFGKYTTKKNIDKTTLIQPNDISGIEIIDEKTMAVIIEAVQGERGVYRLNHEFVGELAKQCYETEVPLIVDEVQTGTGRTSRVDEWFCISHYLKDLTVDGHVVVKGISSAKAMGDGFPISMAISEGDLFEPGEHANTFGGNHRACREAIKTYENIYSKNLLKNAGKIEKEFKKQIGEINSTKIKEVRGMGAMLGIELIPEVPAKEFIQECLKNGLLVLPSDTNTARVLPHLEYTEQDITDTVAIIKEVLN